MTGGGGEEEEAARRLTWSPAAYLKAETDVKTASRSGARKYLELAEGRQGRARNDSSTTLISPRRKKVPAGLTNHHNCFVSLAVYKLVLLLVDGGGRRAASDTSGRFWRTHTTTATPSSCSGRGSLGEFGEAARLGLLSQWCGASSDLLHCSGRSHGLHWRSLFSFWSSDIFVNFPKCPNFAAFFKSSSRKATPTQPWLLPLHPTNRLFPKRKIWNKGFLLFEFLWFSN